MVVGGSDSFLRSTLALTRDRYAGGLLLTLGVGVVLACWCVWAGWAQVAIYETSVEARIEVDRAAHMVQSPVAGRVIVTPIHLERSVAAGDLLLELDTRGEKLRLAETQARLRALASEKHTVLAELRAEENNLRAFDQATGIGVNEVEERYRASRTQAEYADERAERQRRAHEIGAASEDDAGRWAAAATMQKAESERLRLSVARLQWERRSKRSEREVRLAKVKHSLAALVGEIETLGAEAERLRHEIELRRIRAPVAGRVVEVGELRLGSVVQAGHDVGAVLPAGRLRAVAFFLPAHALGRVRPGQPAHLRMLGFPWAQYGMLRATVDRVAGELRDGRVRVELLLAADEASTIPQQHGLPGVIEVEVERVSPATLILRAAGKLVTGGPAGP